MTSILFGAGGTPPTDHKDTHLAGESDAFTSADPVGGGAYGLLDTTDTSMPVGAITDGRVLGRQGATPGINTVFPTNKNLLHEDGQSQTDPNSISVEVPAGTLSADGDSLLIFAQWQSSGLGAPTIALDLGGATIFSITGTAAADGQIIAAVARSAATAGTAGGFAISSAGDQKGQSQDVALTWANALTLTLTVSGSAGGNAASLQVVKAGAP